MGKKNAGDDKRVKEQLRRHSSITNNPLMVVDIQIKQERERLEQKLRQEEDKDDPDPKLIDAFYAFIELLPTISEQIKNKYR